MKKFAYIIISMAVVFWSCDDEALDTKYNNTFGDEYTWKLPDVAYGVLMNAYSAIPALPNSFGNDFLDAATDNAVTNAQSSSLTRLVLGGLSSNVNAVSNWSDAYTQFQYINTFMENGLDSTKVIYVLSDPTRDAITRTRLKGEAYFLRAWWGMELLKVFGGVSADGQALGYPIVTKYLTEADKEDMLKVGRNTYEECIQQIIADCDTAYACLPLAYTGGSTEIGSTQDGRANGKAALALQSRAALFGASPAYQPTGSHAISTDSLKRKWERVVKLSERAINEGKLGAYAALTEGMYVGKDVEKATNAEFLFRKWSNSNTLERQNFPPWFLGQGRTNPSQNLVDAYPAKNGFPITDARSGYDPQDPYKDRDARFDLTVFYNDKMFNTDRPLEIYTDGEDVGRDAPGYQYNATTTGYYLKKFLSPLKNMLYNPETLGATNDFHQFPLLRRAEVYYNLAEALNELAGPNGAVAGTALTAYSILKDIRTKNGISETTYLDEVSADADDFLSLLMNERRIEFSFEHARFFDLRRRQLTIENTMKGVEIMRTSLGFEFKGTDPLGEAIVVEKRNMGSYLYMPLPYDEILKNPNLIQNKGW